MFHSEPHAVDAHLGTGLFASEASRAANDTGPYPAFSVADPRESEDASHAVLRSHLAVAQSPEAKRGVAIQATIVAALTLFQAKITNRDIPARDPILAVAAWHGKIATGDEIAALTKRVAEHRFDALIASELLKDPRTVDTLVASLRCYQQAMRLEGGLPPLSVAATARIAGRTLRMLDIDAVCEKLMTGLVAHATPVANQPASSPALHKRAVPLAP